MTVAFVVVMLSISFTGFFYTVLTGAALSWTYSLARLLIPWVGFLSITIAFARGQHIAMTSLVALLPRPVAAALTAVNYAIVGLLAGLLIWYGADLFLASGDVYMVSDQIQVHSRFVVACVPIGGAILLVHVLCGADLFTDADPMREAQRLASGDEEVSRP
ncbi:TRAP transporter small permease [Acuticoccus sp.]|uniref:TRAP transporter small permease n=1 Tax=Acuticoccus sp. TaxID=1904378 RepID=UPI003B52C263